MSIDNELWVTAQKYFYILPLYRDRQIQIDIEPIIDQLEAGNFLGDQIFGIGLTCFQVRAKNSNIGVKFVGEIV
ncbi:MAG: hypothetical protein V7K72_25045 [Nostoc sp.]|uniref:hypothetical protein n=1 Tax=Nostoc sp. TaxID=1180 RepID=UPI002FF83BC5